MHEIKKRRGMSLCFQGFWLEWEGDKRAATEKDTEMKEISFSKVQRIWNKYLAYNDNMGKERGKMFWSQLILA